MTDTIKIPLVPDPESPGDFVLVTGRRMVEKMEGVRITKRDIEIIQLYSDSLTREQIADRLKLSKRTIDNQFDYMKMKLGIPTVVGIVKYFALNGLIK